MNDGVRFALTLAAALGCGLMGGVFFAFSVFVMRALARLPAAHGSAAMQAINVAVIRPLFLGPFLGTGIACVVLAVDGLRRRGDADAMGLVLGSALYVCGTVVVTLVRNVPLNDSLARLDPLAADMAVHWNRYVATWTAWNHVRTPAALLAACALTLALAAGG